MAGEYQLSYTGIQVNEKLGKIDGLETSVNQIPSTYETKTDAAAKLTEAKNYAATFAYTLPTASSTQLGGVKVGNGLNISEGLLFVNIVNNLNDTSTVNPLSANQGKVLNDTITELKNSLGTLGYGDMLKMTYDTDDDGIVDNAKTLDGYAASYFLTVANPTATGYLSLNRYTDDTSLIGDFSVSLGYDNTASALYSFAEGAFTVASNQAAHAEGSETEASGMYSHSEGKTTLAQAQASHAEGQNTKAMGICAHTEGKNTSALGHGAHAEGVSAVALPDNITSGSSISDILTSWNSLYFSLAKAEGSHVEGMGTLALNQASHAEGYQTISSGAHAHSEGYFTQAAGQGSHVEGLGTISQSSYEHVQGKYNVSDTGDVYAHIIGNGTSNNDRSNAYTLDWNGNAWFQGDVYVGSTSGTNKDEGSVKLVTNIEMTTAINDAINNAITNAIAASY